MSEASVTSYQVSNSVIKSTHEHVWEQVRKLCRELGRRVDFEEVITYITGNQEGTVAENYARAQPIVSALSEGHDLGILDGVKEGKRTLYLWVGTGAKREKLTYKMKYEQVLEQVEALQEQVETLQMMNDRLREENQRQRDAAAKAAALVGSVVAD